MTFARHVPVIEAKVNGKGPFRFALDTGFAGMMMVSGDRREAARAECRRRDDGRRSERKERPVIRQAHVDSFDAR